MNYASYLSTNNSEWLQSLPQRTSETASTLKSMENSVHVALPTMDSTILEENLTAEFRRLVYPVPMSYSHFAREHVQQLPPMSLRTLCSGLQLFQRYLLASLQAQNIMTTPSSGCNDDGNGSTPLIAADFFDGSSCSLSPAGDRYRGHVMAALQYDFAEVSAVDFVCICESVSADFSMGCMAHLRRLMTHDVSFGSGNASRLAAVAIVLTVLDNAMDDERETLLHMIEHNWNHEDVEFLGRIVDLYRSRGI
eukprot:CAMPEP_0176472466 /NCGR_PEP_ID=MMETSP0127-20121128/41759_1 /TAXON_ID=938130 /ORGANISM="Platyophrya macrostoma, Strain WH" /LENGTH=250 /DNA_ID=CAMNT_0017867339 /DNA_START=206 /DNA_END=958 /DNA_ORIENTATION=+